MTAFDILKEAPIITFPQGSIFRHRLEQLMASLELSYSGGFTILNSLAAMIVNIISGLGYGYLPRSIVNPYINQGIMQEFPLADPYSELDIVFIYRKDHLMDELSFIIVFIIQILSYFCRKLYTKVFLYDWEEVSASSYFLFCPL